MTVTAVIPIKQLSDAKQRLAELLNATERSSLFQNMVEDVLDAAESCTLVDDILVVTSDAAVGDLVTEYGAHTMPEPEVPGLIEAVTAAAEALASSGSQLLFLPGDIPLVSADELEVVLDGFGIGDEREFTIVPASDLGGSNCIACSPADCMRFAFGIDSFRKHLRIAEELGLVPTVARLPGIGLDIDTPDDLRQLVQEMNRHDASSNRTFRYLTETGIIERLDATNQRQNA